MSRMRDAAARSQRYAENRANHLTYRGIEEQLRPTGGSRGAMMQGVDAANRRRQQANQLADQYIQRAMPGQGVPTIQNGVPVNQKFMGNDGIEYGWAKKNGQWTAVPWGSVAGTGGGQVYGPGYQGSSARQVPFG